MKGEEEGRKRRRGKGKRGWRNRRTVKDDINDNYDDRHNSRNL